MASPCHFRRLVMLLGLSLTFGFSSCQGSGSFGAASAAESPASDRGAADGRTNTRDSETGAASGSGRDGAVADANAGAAPSREARVGQECEHPSVVRSCEDGLCTIPADCFVMGTPRGAKTAAMYNDVQVEVRLTHSFVIGETEVTRAQWFAMGLPEPSVDWRTTGSQSEDVPPPGQSLCLEPDCPVAWISFEDAVAYANLLSESQGLGPCYVLSGCARSPGENMRCASVRVDAEDPYGCEGYRLPTEAEWEYAARAGTNTDLYSGDLDPNLEPDSFDCGLDKNLDRIGWYCGNSGEAPHMAGTGHPHKVAQKEPNGFGLYDMSGNLFEWANDRYHPDGYGAGPLTDPVNGVDHPWDLTPTTPIYEGTTDANALDGFPGSRIRRGGAFDLWSQETGSGRRGEGFAAGQHTGMRIARTLHPQTDGRAQ